MVRAQIYAKLEVGGWVYGLAIGEKRVIERRIPCTLDQNIMDRCEHEAKSRARDLWLAWNHIVECGHGYLYGNDGVIDLPVLAQNPTAE